VSERQRLINRRFKIRQVNTEEYNSVSKEHPSHDEKSDTKETVKASTMRGIN